MPAHGWTHWSRLLGLFLRLLQICSIKATCWIVGCICSWIRHHRNPSSITWGKCRKVISRFCRYSGARIILAALEYSPVPQNFGKEKILPRSSLLRFLHYGGSGGFRSLVWRGLFLRLSSPALLSSALMMICSKYRRK